VSYEAAMQSSGFPGWFIAVFVLFLLIGIGSGIARFAYRKSKGVNPVFAREQLEAKIINSPARDRKLAASP
jgi:hypothetical protein